MPVNRRSLHWLVPVMLIMLGLSGCSSADRGQREAERRLDAAADGLARQAQHNWRRSETDPTWLAVWAADDSGPLESTAGEPGRLTVRPLAWRRLANGDGEVEVLLDVVTPAHSAVSFADRSYPAGRATQCRTIGTDGTAHWLDCRGRSVPPVPSTPVVPDLDAQTAMITTALRKPTIEAVQRYAQARAHASGQSFTVRAEVVDDSWVLVLTRPRPYACLAGVRGPGGRIRMVTPAPRVMQPGEGGCDPGAILHPAKTH